MTITQTIATTGLAVVLASSAALAQGPKEQEGVLIIAIGAETE